MQAVPGDELMEIQCSKRGGRTSCKRSSVACPPALTFQTDGDFKCAYVHVSLCLCVSVSVRVSVCVCVCVRKPFGSSSTAGCKL
eukprot:2494750-Amphidinium_carterae.1